MSETFVLFHKNCIDGSGAAAAAHLKLGESATYIPVQYKEPLPEIPNQSTVYILDFSYPREVLEKLHARSKSIVILDHHETAKQALQDLPYAKFDMQKSGAVLAWEYFHPGQVMPLLFDLIQDRDLWKFEYLKTRAVTTALMTLVPNFRDYPKYLWNYEDLFQKGTAKMEFDKLKIDAVKSKIKVAEWAGMSVALLNSTDLFSEIGERVYLDYDVDVVAMYFMTDKGDMVFSLRSNREKAAQLALMYDGGGHLNAAGFCIGLIEGATLLHRLYQNSKPLSEFKLNN